MEVAIQGLDAVLAAFRQVSGHEVLAPLMQPGFKWASDAQARLAGWSPVWISVAFLYLPVMFGLQRISPVFKPFKLPLRYLWGLWNLATAVFSLIGFIVAFPAFVDTLRNFNDTCTVPNKVVDMDSVVGECTLLTKRSFTRPPQHLGLQASSRFQSYL